MSRVLSDLEVDALAEAGSAWLGESSMENLVYSLREARRERYKARAELREVLDIIRVQAPDIYEALDDARRALGESA